MPELSKYRVLIIEDEPALVDILTNFLVDLGFSVDSAEEGMKGFIKWRKQEPHLILLDIMMPRLDGISLLKKIRDELPEGNHKVIVISALSSTTKIKEAILYGANDYIRKPIEFDVLVSKIEKLLDISVTDSSENKYLFYGCIK